MIKQIKQHRSIRRFKPTPIDEKIMEEILTAGTRASTTGNMQLYSLVVTTSEEVKQQLLPCHFNQPCVAQAPVLITFCADINRFSKWCVQRGATPVYDNFAWFINAATDALLASQNVALEAEAQGLGICYLGTPLYTAEKIGEILHLPYGVVPLTAMVIGYPDESPQLTDRLPLEGVIHRDVYADYSDDDIDRIWSDKEASELTLQLIEQNGLPNLARIFTDRRYKGEDNLAISRSYFSYLQKQGFFNQ